MFSEDCVGVLYLKINLQFKGNEHSLSDMSCSSCTMYIRRHVTCLSKVICVQ